MNIIGLTGGIASGKSTVSRILERLGAVVIDADQLAREAVMPGTSAHRSIVAAFGEGILLPDGAIDRKALGSIIFADSSARKRLEAITHPAIRDLAELRLAELRRSGVPVAVYMAALLIEAGATDRVDEVWVVYVDRETQVRRVMARDGLSRSEAEQRLAAQMPMEEKAARGQVVIDNNGTPEELERRIEEIWAKRFP
ncbi:dephospho-CoA kinase [Geobacter sulfurreducens]|jgi:dephospho-CoA kinase|uniref:Dephospho-CoA kinase n=1 Tax=Geobacter sulfurreducens (strain ATCC 51573 / DSM 12127 / PCA) TaxID=243231 RepID=COAE_GEOSL|nr:dephospho-CoA kinase [Geobacter sulfurreducens]Q74FU2.1 RecName: Full=Dephospho-CoA kinase; AltName: Full=Dephosphocoenzyme A kinase [Geobacter sulfurreducens PCA]AAR33844.1 dephospho-coenzyme A kinase [Geobacter sulfurreducens PCA]ADI83365.1 dephospho-coenzyme A kinase [Geobacter sulfurreducens KN400]AJY70265.1 dephospho-CoA kinase [Geobacter sulfurreducens]QVW35769.1 dephospho-CoA kinase [Geobacter sulfurreducens]UAC04590.1 dephospho-CoA kinase [Geobacter sulfurreducens]